jgi:hypothetical protein
MPRRAQMYDSLAQLDMFPDIRGTRGEVTMRARGGRVTNSGTGPKDQTCSTCAHFVRRGKHFKCALCRPNWTHSPRTDIRAKSPACTGWSDNSPVSPT